MLPSITETSYKVYGPTKNPMPPSLAQCCHHQVRTRRLGEQPPTMLALLPKELWPNIPPHRPGQKWRALVCYLSGPLWHNLT